MKVPSISVNGWRGASLAVSLAGLLLAFFAPPRRESLFRYEASRIVNSDSLFGGGSEVGLDPTDSAGVRFHYGLVPVMGHPWAGLNLGLLDSAEGPIDLSRWDRLEIRARSTPARPMRVQLLSDDLPPGAVERDSLHRIYHAVEYTPDGTAVEFPWTAFTVPSWWRAQNSRTEVQRIDLLDRLRAIEFQSGDSPTGKDSAVVEILALDLVGRSRSLSAFGWALVLLGLGGLGWSIRRRAPVPVPPVPEALVPGAVSLEDPRSRQAAQLVRRLGAMFADPELSLERFATSEGLSPRLVASLVKEATGLHFKGALNELRLTEAARLLKQSKANISEIGFAVGFQSASHFGRAFREKHGVSPSEFRSAPPSAP